MRRVTLGERTMPRRMWVTSLAGRTRSLAERTLSLGERTMSLAEHVVLLRVAAIALGAQILSDMHAL